MGKANELTASFAFFMSILLFRVLSTTCLYLVLMLLMRVGGGHKTTAAALESDIRTVVIITSGRKVIVDSRAKRVIG